jgi:multimeric flavodoxin WrbA
LKTLIFNGSPRKHGDTKGIINKLIIDLAGECKIVDAYYCNISPCMDCRYCWEYSCCSIKDEWQQVDQYIRECDNIVIASPINFSELPGQLLSIASRLQLYWSARYFRKEEMIQKEKKGGMILVGGGDGSMSAPIATAKILLKQMNVRNIAAPVCFHDTNNKPAKEDAEYSSKLGILIYFLNNH